MGDGDFDNSLQSDAAIKSWISLSNGMEILIIPANLEMEWMDLYKLEFMGRILKYYMGIGII